MAYVPRWNGYKAMGLLNEIKSSAVMGKQAAFNCDSLRTASDVYRQNLELVKHFDEIQNLSEQLNQLIKQGGEPSG